MKIKKSAKKILIISLLICISANNLFATLKKNSAKTFYLGFSDAVNLGLEKSLVLKEQENETKKLELQYKETKTSIYPKITGNLKYQNYVYIPDLMKTQYTDYDKSATINVSQLIYAFGKVDHAIKLGEHMKDNQSLMKYKTQIDIAYEIKKAYLGVLYTRELLKITKQSLENAKTNKKIVINSFAHGRVNQRDNLKMESDIATRIPLIKEAEVNFKLAENYLKRLLYLEDEEVLILTENFENNFKDFNLQKLINQMYTFEPNIQLLSKNIQIQTELSKIQKASKYPTISAFTSYAPFSRTNDAGMKMDDFHNLFIAGINIDFPIFEAGKYKKQYEISLLDLENSKIRLQNLKLDLKLAIENEIYKYYSRLDIYNSNKVATDLAEKSFNVSQEKFSFGKIGLLDLNDAELTLTNARISLTTSLYNINLSLVEINKLISKREF